MHVDGEPVVPLRAVSHSPLGFQNLLRKRQARWRAVPDQTVSAQGRKGAPLIDSSITSYVRRHMIGSHGAPSSGAALKFSKCRSSSKDAQQL